MNNNNNGLKDSIKSISVWTKHPAEAIVFKSIVVNTPAFCALYSIVIDDNRLIIVHQIYLQLK